MSVFSPIAEKTRAREVADRIREVSNQTHNLLVNAHKEIFDIFWNSPDVTAKEVCDEFGTDAFKLFEFGSLMIQLILAANPHAIPPELYIPRKPYTINADGSVTVTE